MKIKIVVQKQLKALKRKSAVCTVSGGLDSAVSAALVAESGFTLYFIFFDWGQKTYKKELECATALAKHYHADLKVIEIPFLKSLSGISMTQNKALTTADNEYVPNRNAILISQTIAYAEHIKAGLVCIGSTGGDHICPDNSPQFVEAVQCLVDEGTLLKPPIQVIAPLIKTDKVGAVKLGLKLGVPFELTWSCHNNANLACGQCSNCTSRLEAFRHNGMTDLVRYKKH